VLDSRPQRLALRKTIVDLILSTDMKQHFGVLSHFKAVVKPLSGLERVGSEGLGGAEQMTANGSIRSPLEVHHDHEAVKFATLQVQL
jgi:hypothetical protein